LWVRKGRIVLPDYNRSSVTLQTENGGSLHILAFIVAFVLSHGECPAVMGQRPTAVGKNDLWMREVTKGVRSQVFVMCARL
jgi:hypothetical protein